MAPRKRGEREKDLDLGSLCISLHRSRLVLSRYRITRVEMVREYAGPYWGADWNSIQSGVQKRQPINILGLYVSVVSRNLISQNPKIFLSTLDMQNQPVVHAMQEAMNKELESMNVATTLTRVVIDALFWMGIAKVALANPGDASIGAWGVAAGQPFIERVDPDDFVWDIHARDLSEADYIGHRVRFPRSQLKATYGVNPKDYPAQEDRLYNLEGDERINVLGRGMYGDNFEYEDYIDLWEVYLRRKNVVVTLADDYMTGSTNQSPGGYGARALKVQKWLGPACGPYHVLGYSTVPGNSSPKGPIQDIYDLHEAVNRGFRKLIRQADRAKKMTMYSRSAGEDANRIQKANDGDLVGLDFPEKVKEIMTGGHDPQLFVLSNDLVQRAFVMGGNLATLGGLSPEARTAHQEMMLGQNSQGMIAALQDMTDGWASGVVKAYLWYVHHHPSHVMRVAYRQPGYPDPELRMTRHVGPAGLPIHPTTGQRWDPEQGVGFHLTRDFPFSEIEVKLYALRSQTPQQRMAAINQLMKEMIMPLLPMLSQQGLALNANYWIEKMAEYLDEPELKELFQYQETPADQLQGAGQGQDKQQQIMQPGPQQTTHVRENVPLRTQQGDSMNLRNALMGVNPGGNPQQTAGA